MLLMAHEDKNVSLESISLLGAMINKSCEQPMKYAYLLKDKIDSQNGFVYICVQLGIFDHISNVFEKRPPVAIQLETLKLVNELLDSDYSQNLSENRMALCYQEIGGVEILEAF
mmetsp:Transcript_34994/g.40439  ORF Transcript_34994/g.40439 Transcript_34994/m.40439 type:complete len:114 (-) Transcript_34994:158-499(-)